MALPGPCRVENGRQASTTKGGRATGGGFGVVWLLAHETGLAVGTLTHVASEFPDAHPASRTATAVGRPPTVERAGRPGCARCLRFGSVDSRARSVRDGGADGPYGKRCDSDLHDLAFGIGCESALIQRIAHVPSGVAVGADPVAVTGVLGRNDDREGPASVELAVWLLSRCSSGGISDSTQKFCSTSCSTRSSGPRSRSPRLVLASFQ